MGLFLLELVAWFLIVGLVCLLPCLRLLRLLWSVRRVALAALLLLCFAWGCVLGYDLVVFAVLLLDLCCWFLLRLLLAVMFWLWHVRSAWLRWGLRLALGVAGLAWAGPLHLDLVVWTVLGVDLAWYLLGWALVIACVWLWDMRLVWVVVLKVVIVWFACLLLLASLPAPGRPGRASVQVAVLPLF